MAQPSDHAGGPIRAGPMPSELRLDLSGTVVLLSRIEASDLPMERNDWVELLQQGIGESDNDDNDDTENGDSKDTEDMAEEMNQPR